MKKNHEEKIAELREEIRLCLSSKKKILADIVLLNDKLHNSIISEEDYNNELNKKYYGRTQHEWLDFCDENISRLKEKLDFCENKIKTRTQQNLNTSLALLVIIFLAVGFFFVFKPTPTGYAVITAEYNYTQNLNLDVSSSSEYAWFLEHPGNLKTIKLNGKISKDGYVQVYIVHNGVKYIMLDSDKLVEKGLIGITGLAILNETESNQTINETNISTTNETTINLSITNETIIVNETINKTETNKTIIIENISKIITINLEYKSGTIYDLNNDGKETIDGIIDFTVENSDFSWNVDFSKLCTKWETYSTDNNEITTVCYGSDRCCGFINIMPTSLEWDESFLSAYGQHGASFENIISAQILYVDYNTSLENSYTDIHNSEWQSLNATFYEDKISFSDVCVDTCLLTGFNETFYTLIFNISNATIVIDSVKYSVLEEINVTLVNVTNITIVNITVVTNVTAIEENLTQYKAVIGKPVKWKKTVKLANETDKLSIKLPKEATNISVSKIINETEKEKVKKIKIKTKNITVDSYNLITGNVIANITNDTIILDNSTELTENITLENITEQNITSLIEENITEAILEENITAPTEENFTEPTIEQNITTNITEYELIEQEDFIELIIEENVTEIEIEYETSGPEAIEENISSYKKRIVVSSKIHYTDILAYTSLPIEAKQGDIKLYLINNSGRSLVDFDYYDINNNSLVDYIEWIVPSLSNKTYEVEIIVLNVQSYPMVMGNWTVMFNTTGRANLTIITADSTTYTEMLDDNLSSVDDLEIKELKCSDEILEPYYVVDIYETQPNETLFNETLALNKTNQTIINVTIPINETIIVNETNQTLVNITIPLNETNQTITNITINETPIDITGLVILNQTMTNETTIEINQSSLNYSIINETNATVINATTNKTEIINATIPISETQINKTKLLSLNATIEIDNKTYQLMTKEQLEGHSYKTKGIFYPDYECSDVGYHTVRVLTTGKHSQKFMFGGQIAYAYNLAGDNPPQSNGTWIGAQLDTSITGLVSYWEFEDSTKDTMNLHNGTAFGAVNTSGRVGRAYGFNGSGAFVNVTNTNRLNTTNISIEFWFKPDVLYDSSRNASFIYLEDGYEVYMKDEKIVFSQGSDTVNSFARTWNTGQWYYVVAISDGVTLYIYIDSEGQVAYDFYIQDSTGTPVAKFSSTGDIVLKGTCSAGSCDYPGDNSFVVQASSGDTVSYVDSNGNLCIEDSNCNYDDSNCNNPGDGSFIIQDIKGNIASYINSTGALCLKGLLTENGTP